MPSIGELLTTAAKMPGALREGVEAVSEHELRPAAERQDTASPARTEQRLEEPAETAEPAEVADETDATTDEKRGKHAVDHVLRRGKTHEREDDSKSSGDGPADTAGGKPAESGSTEPSRDSTPTAVGTSSAATTGD